MPFISLPADVLINILLFVDGFSLIRCKQVCKTLSTLIEDDIGLRYNLELYLTSSIDIPNHLPHLSKKERLTTLQQLHKRKQQWGRKWYHEIIPNTHQSGVILDWSWKYQGGVLICLTATRDVWCFELLKSGSETAMEKRVVKPSPLLGHASAVYIDPKQDLLVIVYSVNLIGNPPYQIHFQSLSNGTAHTGCHKPLLEVNDYLEGTVYVLDVRIYAHLLGFPFFRDEEILVAIFDWKLGELKAVIEGRSFMFLDTQHILVDQINPIKPRLEFIVYDIIQGTPLLVLPFPLEDRYHLEFGKDMPLSDPSSSPGGEGKTSVCAEVDDDGYPFIPDRGLTMITVTIRIDPKAHANSPSTVTTTADVELTTTPPPPPLEIPWGSWAQCTFLLPTIPTPTTPNSIRCTTTYGCRIAVSRNTNTGVDPADESGGTGDAGVTNSVMVYKFHPRWFLGERVKEMKKIDIGGGGGGGGGGVRVEEEIPEGGGELEIQMETGIGPVPRVGSTGVPTSIKTIPLPPVESVVNTMGEQSYIWMGQDLLVICFQKGVQFVRA